MDALQTMRHLLAMAAADQRINEAELGFLIEHASKMGITESQFREVLHAAVSGEIDLEIPESEAGRRKLLKDLVMMMAADGHLADKEKELFAVIAVSMDLSTDVLHRIIDTTIAENQ